VEYKQITRKPIKKRYPTYTHIVSYEMLSLLTPHTHTVSNTVVCVWCIYVCASCTNNKKTTRNKNKKIQITLGQIRCVCAIGAPNSSVSLVRCSNICTSTSSNRKRASRNVRKNLRKFPCRLPTSYRQCGQYRFNESSVCYFIVVVCLFVFHDRRYQPLINNIHTQMSHTASFISHLVVSPLKIREI